MDLIEQYKACAPDPIKIYIKSRMPLKMVESKILPYLARELANNLRVDALTKWDLLMSTDTVKKIVMGIYKTIKYSQKDEKIHCENQHKFLIGGITSLNKYINKIKEIGDSDVKDMIALSNAFINTIDAIYLKLVTHGIDLRISPLHSHFKNIIERLEDITSPKRIERAIAINNLASNNDKDTDHGKLKGNTETLSSLITHYKSGLIVDKLKVDYKNIKGKRLKILLIALQEMKLIPIENMALSFHRCCDAEFDWHIASYNAMNGYRFNDGVDKVELANIKEYLKKLIE
jgi:hypothetical protein